MSHKYPHIPLDFSELRPEQMHQRSKEFLETMRLRRSVRAFSDKPVAREVIENCIKTAGTAPSGANMQPWHFVVVSDPETKARIRVGAEEEEREFYTRRASREWLEALEPLGTDDRKPFLETAPYLIVIFGQTRGETESGNPVKHYYVSESVGIATGLLIASIHQAGLGCLTHTPSPMRFLNNILARPKTERPYLILVVGYPADGCEVPDIEKKSLSEISTFVE
jgi:nitroreductase